MTRSRLYAWLSVTVVLTAGSASAQDDATCDLNQVFNMEELRAYCEEDGTDIQISMYWASELSDDAVDRIKLKLPESRIVVTDVRSTGSGPRTLAPTANRSTALPDRAAINTSAEPGKTYHSISVVLPPSSLTCGDSLNSDDIVVPLVLYEDIDGDDDLEESTKLNCDPGTEGGVQGKALGWRIDLSPIDNKSGSGSEAAIDFNLDKTWGYNYKVAGNFLSWSENTWKIKLDGAVSTNTNTFYNSMKGELAWAYKKYKLGSEATESLFPVYWLSAHLGPEATSDLSNRDLVYGARADAFLNTGGLVRALIPGMRTTASIRPFVSLGIEAVDPDKREDGTVLDNYERATGKLWWKVPVTESVYFEARWEAQYILNNSDAVNLMVDRYTDRIDLAISLAIGDTDEIRPFFKWTSGQKGPLFQDVQEYLIGILWELGGTAAERQ